MDKERDTVSENIDIIPSAETANEDGEDAPALVAVEIEDPGAACANDDHTVFAALPQELSMFTNPSSLLDGFWLYLNYCNVLCLFPFRMRRDKRWRCTVTSSTFQQVICAFLHILFLIFWIKKWRSNSEISSVVSSATGFQSKTKEYFTIILAIAEICYVLALLWTAWTKSLVFQHIANSYHKMAKFEEEEATEISSVDDSLPLPRLLISYGIRLGLSLLQKRFVVAVFLCLLYTALGIKDFWDEYDEELGMGTRVLGPDGYLQNATKEFFFMESVEVPPPILTFLSGLYALVSFEYSLLINLGNLFYAILALMLANLGNNFENLLALPDVTGNQLLGEYHQIKEFVKYINEELGLLTLFMVVSAVPYYATVLPSVLDNEVDRLDRVVLAINLSHYGLVIYLTSTLLEKMRRMQQWFAEKEIAGLDTGVHADQQRIVREELAQDSVALSACGFFAVTYPTVGRILQLLMTYGFIAGEGIPFGLQNVTSAVGKFVPDGVEL